MKLPCCMCVLPFKFWNNGPLSHSLLWTLCHWRTLEPRGF